jgi:hypothetical protein
MLRFLITWLVAGMLLNIWLTPNQSIAVGAIIAVFFATARRTAKGTSTKRIACPRCGGDGYVVTGRDFDRLYTENCPKCLGGKYDLQAENLAAFERRAEEIRRRKYGD